MTAKHIVLAAVLATLSAPALSAPVTPEMAHHRLLHVIDLTEDAVPAGDHSEVRACSPGSVEWGVTGGVLIQTHTRDPGHHDYYDFEGFEVGTQDFSIEVDIAIGSLLHTTYGDACVMPAIGIRDPDHPELDAFDRCYYLKILHPDGLYGGSGNFKLRYIPTADHNEEPLGPLATITEDTGTARLEIVGTRLRAFWNGALEITTYDSRIALRTPALVCRALHEVDPTAFASGIRIYVVETVVPEPAALGLIGLTLLALRRKRS